MKYQIIIERTALKSLRKISYIDREKIIKSIQALADNPRPIKSKELTGREGCRIRDYSYNFTAL